MSRPAKKSGPPYIKLMRSEIVVQLLRDPNAFVLATVIAYRARRTDSFNVHGLDVGEALIGDHASYGLTRQQYRGAMQRLKKWQIATFRSTNKGTIAKLADSSVYDINVEMDNQQANQPATIEQPSSNQQTTTIKNGRMKEWKNESCCGIPPAHDHNDNMRDRFREVIEVWNAYHPGARVDPSNNHADARVAYTKLTDVTRFPSGRATVGLLHHHVLLAITNLAKAQDVPNSQAGRWGLKNFLERGYQRYMPGIFAEDELEETFNAARHKGDRPQIAVAR